MCPRRITLNVARTSLLIAAALGLTFALIAPSAQAQSVELAVELSEWTLGPGQISVPLGEQVHIRLFNNGSVGHGFTIEGLGVNYDSPISAGGQQNVYFTADTAGSFPMFCPIPGHRGQGMEGVFIVNRTQPGTDTTPPVDLTPVLVVIVASVVAALALVLLLRLRRRSEP